MENQKDTAFQMLSNEALLEINRIYKGDHQGFDYFVEVLPINHSANQVAEIKPLIHESFYDAFDEFNERFPWHCFQPQVIDRDFSEYVADLLVERVNDSGRPFHSPSRRQFEDVLGIHLKTRNVEVKTGVFSIDVDKINKETQYHYQEFVDSYAQEIGQKFQLESTTESWETFASESFEFVGTLRISGNSVLLKDSDGDIRYVLPAAQYKFTATPLTYTAQQWEWVLKN